MFQQHEDSFLFIRNQTIGCHEVEYDNFGENQTALQRNSMAAITKNTALPALTLALMAEHSPGVHLSHVIVSLSPFLPFYLLQMCGKRHRQIS